MDDDRTALIRYLTHLEGLPRPEGWIARLRRAWEIRQADGMLEWDDARQEGPACLVPLRNGMISGLLLLWIGSSASVLFFSHNAITLARTARVVGFLAMPVALGIWYWVGMMPRMWATNERRYARHLARAKALPAQAGDGDARAAV